MKVKDIEIVKVHGGGLNITGTIINYLAKIVTTIYEVGQGFGGAIRRIASNNVCKI